MKCRMIMTVVFDKPLYIYRLVLKRWNTIHFSKETLDSTRVKRVNPKRM